MKKILFLSFLLVMFCDVWAQRILVADNTPTAPGGSHIFPTLQAAIDASLPGDIIHVKSSATSYGNISITPANDSITIYGIGYNPIKEISQTAKIGQLEIEGFNIKIAGFEILATVFIGTGTTPSGNISFENNTFSTAQVYVGYIRSISNILFRNNIFYGFIQQSPTLTNSTVFNNCIFSYGSTTTAGQIDSYNGTLFSHCLFFGVGGSNIRNSFRDCQNSTVSNSIFYGRSPQASTSISNTTFNNCYAAEASDNNFPTGNGNSINGIISSISGNVFQDANILLTQNWNKSWNPVLDSESIELLNGGDNGTDIGLTGGTIPYDFTGTPLPYIESLVLPSVIKRGDNLNIKVKAKSN